MSQISPENDRFFLSEWSLNGLRTSPITFYQVLSVLHKRKSKEPDLEEMLHRLYKPLLWRALDAANGDVRANATTLFLSLFPLIPAHFNKVQFNDTLEEQCSKIKVCNKQSSNHLSPEFLCLDISVFLFSTFPYM